MAQDMVNTYDVVSAETGEKQSFTDAKEAGAAFFAVDRVNRPAVIHTMEGNRARLMANTEIHGIHANGEQRFVKALPQSHVVDAEFRLGFMEALEVSLQDRLAGMDWGFVDSGDPEEVPSLDGMLYDDLERLSRVDFGKAVKMWERYVPGVICPTFLDSVANFKEEVMSFTMAQVVNAGLPFNPLSSEDGQGHAYAGQNHNRLVESMAAHDWKDLRFLTEAQVLTNGWAVQEGAQAVPVVFKDGQTGQWDEKLLYNAGQVEGIPSLVAMLESALMRLQPEEDLAFSVSQAPVRAQVQVPFVASPEVSPWESFVDAEELAMASRNRERDYKEALRAADKARDDAEFYAKKVVQQEVDAPESDKGLSWEGDAVVVMPVVKTQGHDQVVDGRATPEYLPVPVLGRLFKERVEGSGEYMRGDEKKFSFKDKGDTLVIRDKKPDSFQAVMELAKAKGWESIELSGKPEHVAQGWIEAQLMGIQVANFVPTEKDVVALEERRKAFVLEAMVKSAPAGAQVVTEGRHIGKVVDVVDGFAIQDGGRGQFKAHALNKFEKAPLIGEMMDVQYRGGLAKMVKPLEQGLGQGRER